MYSTRIYLDELEEAEPAQYNDIPGYQLKGAEPVQYKGIPGYQLEGAEPPEVLRPA